MTIHSVQIRLTHLAMTALALAGISSTLSQTVTGTPDSPGGLPSVYQVILDVEDADFQFLSDDWDLTLSSDLDIWGYYAFRIDGPGDGSSRGRWIAEGLPAGSYEIEFYAPSGDFPADARYQVVHAGGISDVVIDMNSEPGGWHPLGTFDVNAVCVVYVSDLWSGAGTQMYADALRFTLQSALPAPPAASVPPHIGLCIDDLGGQNPASSTTPTARMLAMPLTMTYAVLPGLTYTEEAAEAVHAAGSEVILHQPMGAISIPEQGALAINDSTTPAEARVVLANNLDALPHVAGMNNHTGSLITQRAEIMDACMDVLLERDLFFLDSRTFTYSVAYDVARDRGALAGERDLFIDGTSDQDSLDYLRELALRALWAPELPHIGIGHIRTGTADALDIFIPELEAMGVEVWPISRCLHHLAETDHVYENASVTSGAAWTASGDDAFSKMLHDGDSLVLADPAENSGEVVAFSVVPQLPGLYELHLIWSGDSSNAQDATVEVQHLSGQTDVPLDQTQSIDRWHHLGRFPAHPDQAFVVTVLSDSASAEGTTLRADAVRLTYAGPLLDATGGLLR